MTFILTSSRNQKLLRRSLLCAAMVISTICLNPLIAQTTQQERPPSPRQAEENPRSILFPSGVPGPYFPNDAEIARAAEERLNNNQPQTERTSEDDRDLSVEVTEIILSEEDHSAYGTIKQSEGGLAKTIWKPSDFDKIAELLAALNLPLKSPAMDDISQRLLLSVAHAPTGENIENGFELSPDERDDENDPESDSVQQPQQYDEALLKSFINLRIAELIERGNLTDLVGFIQNLPQGTLKPEQQNAEILMLGGDLIGACQITQTARRQSEQTNIPINRFAAVPQTQQETISKQEIFWLKMLSFCRVLEENNTGAQIALDMLGEQGTTDFVFFDLINKLMEDADTRVAYISSGMSALDPLNYTILTLLDQPINADLIETSPPLVISALVINSNVSAENRLLAAVKSFLSGGVSVDVLRNIFDLQDFTAMEYNNAARLAQFDDRPMADVLLYQAASKQTGDLEKAEILDIIWTRALENNDLPRKAALNVETLMALNPTSRLINHAHHITRGLLLGGETERAIQWYDFARSSAAGGDAEATRALINIWPLVIIAADKGEIPWSEEILNLWWNGQMVLAPAGRDSKAALFYALVEAFDYQVSDDKWSELITENRAEKGHSIPLGVWREMIRAVGENKPAQSIILSLIAMGQDGPASLDASGISTVVRLLRSFGLESEARKVAIEALAANDF